MTYWVIAPLLILIAGVVFYVCYWRDWYDKEYPDWDGWGRPKKRPK